MPQTALLTLDAGALAQVVRTFRDALAAHREAINRLNVYPVPDGDTGTNMALTLESVVAAIEAAQSSPAAIEAAQSSPAAGSGSLGVVCEAIATGSLMGARGNSGVIMSQILRGLCEVLETSDAIDGPIFAAGLGAAAKAAYGAVQRPVEGTILTVVREAAEAVAAPYDASLSDTLDTALAAARDALVRTPDMLAVLKDAGVVDAGGTGLVLFFEAALHVVCGRPVSPAPAAASVAPRTNVAVQSNGETRFEVMYLLHLDDASIGELKSRWDTIGDSIVVVGGKGLWNCHVHTNDIGAAIEVALELGGRPHKIRVSDLFEEMAEQDWVAEASSAGVDDPLEAVTTAVVAVAAGDGLRTIFRSLGVQRVVSGGQSMNPSTADLLAAVEATAAESVVILPNNRNIIAVAEQVGPLTSKRVAVIPTKGVSEGLASLVAYDPEADLDENAHAMADAASAIAAGEITQAVRDATSPAGPVKIGDYLGLARNAGNGAADGIVAVAASVVDAAAQLLACLVSDEREIVTIVAGDSANPGDTETIATHVAEHYPDLTVEVHYGGQPLYPYFIGIE